MTLLDIARKKETTIQKVSVEIKQLSGIDVGWDPTQIIKDEIVELLFPMNTPLKDITQNTLEIKGNANCKRRNRIASSNHQSDLLRINSIVDVKVEQINDKSVFVKYKDLRGIIYGSDMFWGYVTFKNHLSEGDTIKAKVIEKNIDEKGYFNVRFNHKDCLPNPWEQTIYEESQIVEGPVIKVDDRGVIIKIGVGIEGYLHINDMTKMEYEALKLWEPSNGDVNVAIKSVNKSSKQIYLTTFSLSQEIEDKWKNIGLTYEVNKAYHAKVIMNDGTYLWVQLEEGLEASIYKNELSWSRTQGKKLNSYHLNDDVNILITSIDIHRRVIKASIRELLPNPWETAGVSLNSGDICIVEVLERKRNALIVETLDSFHLIGSIKMSELCWFQLKQEEEPQIGWKLEAKVMAFQPDKQVLKLSVKHLQEDPWNSLYLGAEVYGTVLTKTDPSFINLELENKLSAKTSELELLSQIGKKYPFKIVSCNRATQEIIVSHNSLMFDQQTEEIVKSFFNV